MKKQGRTLATEEFTDKMNENFRYGDLFLVVYDMKGMCIAHGGNSEFVGHNQYNDKDEDGRYYIRSMITLQKIMALGGKRSKKINRLKRYILKKLTLVLIVL